MDLSVVPPGSALIATQGHPDQSRQRPTHGHAKAQELRSPFTLIMGDPFDSSAPVTVDAGTEAALIDLRPVDAVPLAEAIHRYVDDV